MCRLFGFRSVIPSQVHRSLVSAENALRVQSEAHPDGWGVAYYVESHPHVIKSAASALDDHLFRRVSGIVSSETVVAHVRRATQGTLSLINSHPFQYGKWVMAHNGNIPDFAEHRPRLLQEIAPRLRRFILGDTDSEVLFYIFLTRLARRVDLQQRGTPLDDVVASFRETVDLVRALVDTHANGQGPSLLTMMITDGALLVAGREGRELYRSTYKSRCADREGCPNLTPECEAPSSTGLATHFIVSSEPLLGENVSEPLEEGEVAAVDWHMRTYSFRAAS